MPRPNYNFFSNYLDTGTTDLDAVAAGTLVPGPTLDMARVAWATLAALVTVEAETEDLTITGKWQVSADGTTWIDLVSQTNAAAVVMATGTAGADSPVTKAVEPLTSIFGWAYARYSLVTGGATGAAVDTYRIGYCFADRFSAPPVEHH